MGCGPSKEDGAVVPEELKLDPTEIKKDSAINQQLKKEADKDVMSHKLLLLGPGEAGKSTFFKQMRIAHSKGYSDEERKSFKEIIRESMVSDLSELGAAVKGGLSAELSTFVDEIKAMANDMQHNFEAGSVFTDKLVALWNHPDVQAAWNGDRSALQVADCLEYFMSRFDAVATEDYLPSNDDIIRFRTRTSGVFQEEFQFSGGTLILVDVGGQRSERRKWVKCFDKVTAVLFVAAIGEFDRSIFEDRTTNRLQEALSVWDTVVAEPTFSDKTIALFLNKVDLFEQKIKAGVSLSKCFPELEGKSMGFDEACTFVESKFLERVTDPSKRVVTFFTCATDTDKATRVILTVRDSILRKALKDLSID